MDFIVPADNKLKIKENDLIHKYLDLPKVEKDAEHEINGDTNSSWNPWNISKMPGKETEGIGDQSKNQDYPDHNTIKIG